MKTNNCLNMCRAFTRTEQLISKGLRLLPIKHGKHRILDHIFPVSLGPADRTVAVPYHGVSLRVDIDELVGWHFAMIRSFDPEVSEVLLAAAREDEEEVFWDIGANKGTCSYAMAVGLPNAKIVAIEPQARLAANVKYNLSCLCPGRFEHHSVGINTQDDFMELSIPEGNSGQATLHPERMNVSGRTESIRLVKATTLVKTSSFGWPTLVKIDVEGHEFTVIESLAPCLENNKCRAIVFENHADDKTAFESILSLVTQNGHKIFGITKTPFSTRLIETRAQLRGTTDYVIASPHLLTEHNRFKSMIV